MKKILNNVKNYVRSYIAGKGEVNFFHENCEEKTGLLEAKMATSFTIYEDEYVDDRETDIQSLVMTWARRRKPEIIDLDKRVCNYLDGVDKPLKTEVYKSHILCYGDEHYDDNGLLEGDIKVNIEYILKISIRERKIEEEINVNLTPLAIRLLEIADEYNEYFEENIFEEGAIKMIDEGDHVTFKVNKELFDDEDDYYNEDYDDDYEDEEDNYDDDDEYYYNDYDYEDDEE